MFKANSLLYISIGQKKHFKAQAVSLHLKLVRTGDIICSLHPTFYGDPFFEQEGTASWPSTFQVPSIVAQLYCTSDELNFIHSEFHFIHCKRLPSTSKASSFNPLTASHLLWMGSNLTYTYQTYRMVQLHHTDSSWFIYSTWTVILLIAKAAMSPC